MTEGKPLRHRYPVWLSAPLEIVAFLLVAIAAWGFLRTGMQVLFQQWPQALGNLAAIPYAQPIALLLSGTIPRGPVLWEELYPKLIEVSARGALLLLLAATVRNVLPSLRILDKGLQVRRGLGWATIPWENVHRVDSMTLAGGRLILFIQGQHWRVGPWFRLHSLLWGAGLKKGLVATWHMSDFEALQAGLVTQLRELYGEDQLEDVVDDNAYSLFYALLFLPGVTWKSLFAPREDRTENAFMYPRWIRLLQQVLVVVVLALSIWRYIGVWWRFLAGSFPTLLGLLKWPILGPVFRLFGTPNRALFGYEGTLLTPISWPGIALLLGQVSIILGLATVALLQGLLPDWQIEETGPSASYRRRWLPIPWAAIRAIRESIPIHGRGTILVQVKWPHLTFWHTLYSLILGAAPRRGILFTSWMPGFEDLRQRFHLGVIHAHEGDATPPEKPILVEHGESDMLLMAQAPIVTLRRWGGQAPPEPEPRLETVERPGGLLKRPGLSTTAATQDLPWESAEREPVWPVFESPTEEAPPDVKFRVMPLIRSIAPLVLVPVVLVLVEELLFPPLTRTLAFLSVPSSLPAGGLPHLLALAVAMAVLALGEAPLLALLVSVLAEVYGQSSDFRRALSFYPRIQSPRVLLALIVLAVGATGVFQPLFLLWWFGGLVWGGILSYLAARDLLEWRGTGRLLLPGGYAAYQVLVLVLYLVLH